jgi:hypothetical protein
VRKLLGFAVVLIGITLQQPSNMGTIGMSSVEATTLGRSIVHWEYTYKNWAAAQSALTTRGFRPVNNCHRVRDIPQTNAAGKNLMTPSGRVEFTWKCDPALVSYCYIHQGSDEATCLQAHLWKDYHFGSSAPRRGHNQFRVFVSNPRPPKDGTWNLSVENQCWWSESEQRLICPDPEGTAQYKPCSNNVPAPQNQKLASGFLQLQSPFTEYEEFKIVTGPYEDQQIGLATLKVRKDSLILKRLYRLHGSQVDVVLETKSSPSKLKDLDVSQEGNLLLIERGNAFGVQDIQVRIHQTERCANNLQAFHSKEARLVIRTPPSL